MTLSITLALATQAATERLAGTIAAGLAGPCVIYLRGDLGAGKTTFARGLLRALGHEGLVKSPTYTLVESYETAAGHQVLHFDLYRIGDPEELEYIGMRDFADGQSVLLIEWPEHGRGMLPFADLDVRLSFAEVGRQCRATAISLAGESLLAPFQGDGVLVGGNGDDATKL